MSEEIKQYLQYGKKNLILIYVLYLCGIIVPLFPIVGALIAYINKGYLNPEGYLKGHYIFLLRTFCGVCIAKIISIPLNIILIGIIVYAIACLWFITRTVVGFKFLIEDSPIPNPLTFWIK